MKSFGTTLRALREREKLSVKAVVKELKKYGQDITDKTLYSYENNKRAASADMLLALCQIYNCNNILETFAGIKPDYSIPSDEEWKIIEKYRSLTINGQETVMYVLDKEVAHAKSEKEKEEQIQKQAEYILQLENRSSVLQRHKTRLVQYYHRLASAGSGQFVFDNLPVDTVEIPDTQRYRAVKYAVGVNGDSMEPDFHDGDILLIEPAKEIQKGEIGIFIDKGDSFVKRLGDNELIASNPKYENIPLTSDTKCLGKVIGNLSQNAETQEPPIDFVEQKMFDEIARKFEERKKAKKKQQNDVG